MSTASNHLRLIQTPKFGEETQQNKDPRDVLKFERRRAHRFAVSGRVTSLRNNEAQGGTRNRISSLQLINISDTGLGAMVQEELPINSPIAIFFPPHGAERGFDRYGHVVRCTPKDWGHEVGIRFDVKPAA